MLFTIISIAAMVGLDQLTKYWATLALAPDKTAPFLPGIMELRYVLNDGAAFSVFSGKVWGQWFLIAVTSAALLAVLYVLFFKRARLDKLGYAALLLIEAGGIGNLIDRVLNGEVVDYINLLFMRFAVFNFADICVCVGVALWVLVIFLEELHEDTKKGPKEQ